MKRLVLLCSLFISIQLYGDETVRLTPFLEALEQFSENIPQEKVYLHFDNTSYYHNDDIWFKAYVVTSGEHELSPLSKTLYVELLNPGGEIVSQRVLKVKDGQCHGEFTLNHLPFYSGFYEVRAYTKYMLNFGKDLIFTRLLPVFDKPKTEGNFEEKEMLKYNRYGPAGSKYPMKRKAPEKGKDVNLRFFPEGGNLLLGVASRMAFEVTDEAGNPIDVSGIVMNADKQELCKFTTLHEGKGLFTYTATGDNKRKDVAEVEYSGKKYRFDLPPNLPQGVVMETDNLSHPDSIEIILKRNDATPAEVLGVAVLSGGKLQTAHFVHTKNDRTTFKADKTGFPSGVSQIVLFNRKGDILCDRLVFVSNDNNFLDIKAKTDKRFYQPYETVEMDFSVTDRKSNPVNTTFSLSIRDGANEVEGNHNILTDLLLMSEIKGYVRNPSYYFETDDETHRAALDALLMVQGWRRYSWKQMTGIEPFDIKYFAEQGLETSGRIVSFVKQIPKPNVDVTLMISKLGEEEEEGNHHLVDTYITDSLGRFSFVSDVMGKWNLMVAATEKGKRKDHRIILDRVFSPKPEGYRYVDLQVIIDEGNKEEIPDMLEENIDSLFFNYSDSLSKLAPTDKVRELKEVVVTSKRSSRAQDILSVRQNSAAYYDVASELDDIYDRGKYIGDDLLDMLVNTNKDFQKVRGRIHDYVYYKNLPPVFVINYERVDLGSNSQFFRFEGIKVNAIKSIYINESETVKCQYLYHHRAPCGEFAHLFSGIVFIETYPDDRAPAESIKGVRKTWLEGYSNVKEFYHPNYTKLSPDPDDYRRTLYWNPMVATDENGNVKIQFYNNQKPGNFRISAETVTAQGKIGVYNSK